MSNIVRLEHRQRLFGKELMNVYHYLTSSEVLFAEELLELIVHFVDTIVPPIQQIQSEKLETTGVYATVVGGTIEVLLPLEGVTGLLQGDAMPRFVTYTFRMNRATKATRSGRKAIAGCTEGFIVDGVADPALDDDFIAIGLAINTTFRGVSSIEFVPAIVRFENGVPTAANTISSVEFTKVSTQNTRKS